MLLTLGLTLLGIYFGLLGLMFIFQERLIFFPTQITHDEIKALQKAFPNSEISFKTPQGNTLHGWLVKTENPENHPLILYYGGNAEEISGNLWEASRIKNASILFLNYRGYGRSEGRPSEQALVQDAIHSLDYMVEQLGFDRNNIYVMGRSLGSGVAIQVAARRPVRGLILITPFDSLRNVGQKAYRLFPVGLLLRHPFNSLALSKHLERPALFLLAERDSVIPRENSLNLIHSWKGPSTLVTIPHSDHNDLQLDPGYWAAINEFLEKNS